MKKFVKALEHTRSWFIYSLAIEVLVDDMGNIWLLDAYEFQKAPDPKLIKQAKEAYENNGMLDGITFSQLSSLAKRSE